MSEQKETPVGLRGAISGFVVAEDIAPIERARLAVARASADFRQNADTAVDALRGASARVASHPSYQTMQASYQAILGLSGLVGLMMRGPGTLPRVQLRADAVSRRKMMMIGLCGLSFLAAVFLPERNVKPGPADAEAIEEIRPDQAVIHPSEPLRLVAATVAVSEKPMPPRQAEPVLALREDSQLHWQAVRRPIPIYHLEAPDVESAELDYQVFARGRTIRQDRLRWTPRAGSEAQRGRITLVIERFESHAGTERPLLADMAQRAADQHFSIERLGQPAEIATKFGAMQVADGAFSGEGGTASCTVFRRIDMSGVTIAGWYCAPSARPLDRVRLACFLNRLNLMSAGNDQGLRSFFTKADLNRLPCVSSKQAGRKTTWMDHEAPMPPLKLSGKVR